MPKRPLDRTRRKPSEQDDLAGILQTRLAQWFRSNRRSFPWRETKRSPYEILIAEIMLQKTRAENIVPTYRKFIRKYPDFESLSRADIQEIKRIVGVLGLSNMRARNLLRVGQEVVKNGRIPRNREQLLKIPGVGPYIANAFLLYAYNERLPVVDTNVRRLYGRIFSFESKKDPRRDKNVWIFAEKLLPICNYKEFTWALMDFCASVCKPKNPLCRSCPISDICDYGQQVLLMYR